MGQKGSMKWGGLHSKEGRAEQGPSGEGRALSFNCPPPPLALLDLDLMYRSPSFTEKCEEC